ncbi:hypothetical protein BC567DRAFT_51421 [Phyllosticta citribraziliensis]
MSIKNCISFSFFVHLLFIVLSIYKTLTYLCPEICKASRKLGRPGHSASGCRQASLEVTAVMTRQTGEEYAVVGACRSSWRMGRACSQGGGSMDVEVSRTKTPGGTVTREATAR